MPRKYYKKTTQPRNEKNKYSLFQSRVVPNDSDIQRIECNKSSFVSINRIDPCSDIWFLLRITPQHSRIINNSSECRQILMTTLNGFEGLKRLFKNTLSHNKSRSFVAVRAIKFRQFIYGNYIYSHICTTIVCGSARV